MRTHALATRVLLDDTNRASGVEYLAGERLYRADPRRSEPGATAERRPRDREARGDFVRRCVQYAATAKLSGIGPRARAGSATEYR